MTLQSWTQEYTAVRIGIDYSAAVNQSAGIGRFVRNLVSAIAEVDPRNDYVLLHAAPNQGRTPEIPDASNFSVRRLPLRERFMTILWHRLHVPFSPDRLMGNLDIFHAPDFVLPPVKSRVKLLTVHDLAFLIHPECAHEGLRKFLEQAVPRSIERADYILADSENTKSDVVCLMDADPDKVFVIPGGVDDRFTPAGAGAVQSTRDTYGITEPYILGVGTIEPRKNWPRLIEAYARFRIRTGLPYQLVIAGGTGWLSEATFQAAARSPYSEDIRLTGFTPDQDLVSLYSGAEVFACPSLYEGSVLPVLEAMACGAPVVCSNTSCFPEAAEGAAMLVSPTDPDEIAEGLEHVALDENLRSQLQTSGTARAAEFSWTESARRLVDVYERVGSAA
jgi:glycosyltransferase involved in cell wall biosynthesis